MIVLTPFVSHLITDDVGGVGLNVGLSGRPSIILGNCLQQPIYMEFDLENSRLGFLLVTKTTLMLNWYLRMQTWK